jgi:hypothetical protein
MKRFIILLAFAPGAALAGLQIVSNPPKPEQAKQVVPQAAQVNLASLSPTAAAPTAIVPKEQGKVAVMPAIVAAKPANAGAAVPAAIAPAPVVVAPKPVQTWSVTVADKSVRALLERWSKSAGYQLVWEISVDLELNANATMTGSFEDALTSVLASLKNSDYPIEAMIYDNKVVRMVKRTPRNK